MANFVIKKIRVKILMCAALLLSTLNGCSSLNIDTSLTSKGFDHRVQLIVLHYTSTNLADSLHLLTESQVSSHYLLSQSPVRIYRLVDEKYRAWHAGESQWQGRTWLNASSIGIELVHPGYSCHDGERVWHEWDAKQIDELIPLLHDITKRYSLPINSIVGHSDIAPQRKQDPGPKFPWVRLAQEGLIDWPDDDEVAKLEHHFQSELPAVNWYQQQLGQLGYAIVETGELDEETVKVLAAFQMKYRPANFDGQTDAQTAAILASLVRQQQANK